MPPIPIGNQKKLQIGCVAKRNITQQEELFFDYGIQDSKIPWFKSDTRRISTVYSSLSPEPPTSTSLKKPYKRKRSDCTIDGCYPEKLLKLSDHLKQVHKILDAAERKKLL